MWRMGVVKVEGSDCDDDDFTQWLFSVPDLSTCQPHRPIRLDEVMLIITADVELLT